MLGKILCFLGFHKTESKSKGKRLGIEIVNCERCDVEVELHD